MAATAKRCIKPAMTLMLVLMFALSSGGSFASTPPVQETGVNKLLYGVRGHSAPSPDMIKILSVLEKRVEDGKLMEKAKEKLATLNGEELGLIASLCERIEARGHDAGADIAFLMAAMLVVLS
jgi:hypothetical protein